MHSVMWLSGLMRLLVWKIIVNKKDVSSKFWPSPALFVWTLIILDGGGLKAEIDQFVHPLPSAAAHSGWGGVKTEALSAWHLECVRLCVWDCVRLFMDICGCVCIVWVCVWVLTHLCVDMQIFSVWLECHRCPCCRWQSRHWRSCSCSNEKQIKWFPHPWKWVFELLFDSCEADRKVKHNKDWPWSITIGIFTMPHSLEIEICRGFRCHAKASHRLSASKQTKCFSLFSLLCRNGPDHSTASTWTRWRAPWSISWGLSRTPWKVTMSGVEH